MEGSENRPYCLMPPLFGKKLVEEDESRTVDARFSGTFGKGFADCGFDVGEVIGGEGFVETLSLEVLDFRVAEKPILIAITEDWKLRENRGC